MNLQSARFTGAVAMLPPQKNNTFSPMVVPWALHQVSAQGRCGGSQAASTMVYVEAWEKGNIGNAVEKPELKPLKSMS